MALLQNDQEKVDKFTFSYEESYLRIVKFYKKLAADWQIMTLEEKQKLQFYPRVNISLTTPYINSLPDESCNIFFVLAVAQLIRSSKKNEKQLEFAYHIKDEYGIKLGMYAEYLLKQFQIIDSFK